MRRALSIVLVTTLLVPPFGFAQDPPPEAPPAEPAPAPAPAPAAAPVDIRQVQVQVWISETSEQGLRQLGANLNFTRFVRGVEQSGSVQQVNTNVFNPVEDFGGVTMPVPDQGLFPAPLRPDENNNLADGLQSRSGFGLTANVIDSDTGTIDAVFRATERQADVDLISKPELLVANGSEATIKAGGQVPYQDVQTDAKGNSQLQITFGDTGVNLGLQPAIQPNDFVKLHIKQLEVTDIERIESIRGVDLPVFAKRSQTGVVTVPSGQTLVIGGLSSRVVRKTERRVPVLGQLPIVGMPFRSRNSEADITHLLIFVSPTVVDLRNITKQGFNALNFWKERGSQWDNTERIEREIEAMEVEL
jgi:general secretion pathway protein D